jgi:hypothetical protein
MGAALAEGSGVASVVVVAARVDSVSVVEALPMVVSIATELSISIATTSDGDEPHDTHINNENATVGLIKCLSRGVISRD